MTGLRRSRASKHVPAAIAFIVVGAPQRFPDTVDALERLTGTLPRLRVYTSPRRAWKSKATHRVWIQAGASLPDEKALARLCDSLEAGRAIVLCPGPEVAEAALPVNSARGLLTAFPNEQKPKEVQPTLFALQEGAQVVIQAAESKNQDLRWACCALLSGVNSVPPHPHDLADVEPLIAAARAANELELPAPQAAAVRESISRKIGSVIATHPETRQEVMDRLKGVAEPVVSTRQVNVACSSTLVVTYAFPPFLDTSGLVVARKFANSEHAYDVVTQDMSAVRPRDARALDMVRAGLGRRMQVPGRPSIGNWSATERFCREGMRRIDARLEEQGAYEALYSRSMWPASSLLAAWYKARHPETPWTAEISDPFTVSPNGQIRNVSMPANTMVDVANERCAERGLPPYRGDEFFEACEWLIYALADTIIFTNENQRDFMLERFPDPDLAARARSIARVEHHPVPQSALYSMGQVSPVLDPNKVTIAYFGRFYPVRGVKDLLDPFAALSEAERERVQFLIFTQDRDDTSAAVDAHPARECTTVLDALPYLDFLATAKAVDWLLIADAHRPDEFTVNPYLPSKYADYAGADTPVWGLVDAGSVLSRKPLAAASPLGDAAAATVLLREKILA